MFLLTLVAVAAAQWTGPRTVEFEGPGYYCGGGYAIRLVRGERALVLPQGHGPQATRLVLSGGEVNILTGARAAPGKVVQHSRGSSIIQQGAGAGTAYVVSDETPFGLRIESGAFHGYNRDRWFFAKANFASNADETVRCLSARSY